MKHLLIVACILLGLVLISCPPAVAATDGFYLLSKVATSWDGTVANRTNAITADYSYSYGDEATVTYALPWSFSFYGQSYSQITADTNGNIWFGTTGSTHSFNLANNGRGPVIAAWNNDLSSYYYGGVYIQHKTNPERVVIEWQTETYTTEGFAMPNNFEAVIFPNGEIRLDYKSFSIASANKDFGSGISSNDGLHNINLTNDRGNVFTLGGQSFLFKVDKAPPAGTVTINSGSAATNNSTVTLTLACSDPGGCSKMQFSNDNIVWSSPESYATTKVWTLTAGDQVETVYAKLMDVAGNWMPTATVDTIVLDTVSPTASAAPMSGTFATSQIVALTCNDGTGSGCDKIYYTTDGSTPTTSSSVYTAALNIAVTSTLKYFATDKAGNAEAVRSQTYTIDKTAPAGTVVINAGAAATNSTTATLTLTCSDANGCSQMQFSNNNSTWSTPEVYATSKAWTLTAGDGIKTVYAKFKDVVGNWMTTGVNDTIVLDSLAPATTSAPVGGTYTTAQSVTLTCNDGTGSGCDKIYYTTDGSTPTTSSSVYTAALNIASTITLKYFAKDKAGNSEALKSQTYTITDTTPPTGTMVISAGAAATNSATVILTLTCNDAGGCSQMQFSNDNTTWSTPEVYTTSKAWLLTTGDGTKTVYAKFKDVAGNWMTTGVNDTIVLDSVAPATTSVPVGGTYTTAQNVTLTCSDGTGSGCDKIYYTTDGSTPTTSSSVYTTALNIVASVTLKYFATDKVGNAEAVKAQVYIIGLSDTMPPETTAAPMGGTYDTPQSLTFTCSDGTGSGCDKIYYTTDGSIPSTASRIYSAPIYISTTTNLKYFAIDMAGNMEVVKSQTYNINTYTITATAGTGGTIYPASVAVSPGASQTFTITPSAEYIIQSVYVDGVSQGITNTYTFSNVVKGHTINAYFKIDPSACSNKPIRIPRGATTTYFTSLQAAYDAAIDGDIIQVQMQQLVENLSASKDISVTIDGGYSCNFEPNPDVTYLLGAVSLGSGKLMFKNFQIIN